MSGPTGKTFDLAGALRTAKTLVEQWATQEKMVPPSAVRTRARDAVAEALMQHGEGAEDPILVRTIAREQTARVADDGNRRDRERAREMLKAWGRS